MTGEHAADIRETGRDRGPANHVALTPLSYLDWAETVYPDKPAVIHRARCFTYREFGPPPKTSTGKIQKFVPRQLAKAFEEP